MASVIVPYWLNGSGNVPAAADVGQGPWVETTVETAGSPNAAYLSESVGVYGGASLTLTSDSEVQNCRLNWNDVLSIDLNDLHEFGFRFQVATALGSNSVAVWGLGSEDNDDEDSVAESIWIKIEGADDVSAVVAESDDATTNNDDISTGFSITAGTWYKAKITFKEGSDVLTDCRFYIQATHGPGGDNVMSRVASGTTFDISGYTAATRGVQPYFQLSKASSADAPVIYVGDVYAKVEAATPELALV